MTCVKFSVDINQKNKSLACNEYLFSLQYKDEKTLHGLKPIVIY